MRSGGAPGVTALDRAIAAQIGLANPIAAHTERLKHGRIGHEGSPGCQQAGPQLGAGGADFGNRGF